MNNAAQKEWWFPVSGCILKSERLTGEQKLVWLTLCAFRDTETGRAHPSMQLLGRLTGLGQIRLRAAIKRLTQAGLLTVQQRRDGKFNRGYVFTVKTAEITEASLNQHLDEVLVSGVRFELAQTERLKTTMNYSQTTTASLTTAKERSGSSDDERPAVVQTPGPQTSIRFEGKTLSPEAVRRICEQQNVPEHLTEAWAEDVRNTGTIQGQKPTQAFLIGRIEHFERCRTGR